MGDLDKALATEMHAGGNDYEWSTRMDVKLWLPVAVITQWLIITVFFQTTTRQTNETASRLFLQVCHQY